MDSKVQRLLDIIVGDSSEETLDEARPPMSDEKKRELLRRHRRRILRNKDRLQKDTERINYDRNRLGKLLTRKV